MKFSRNERPSGIKIVLRNTALAALTAASVAACGIGVNTVQHGYVLNEEALAQVPVGSSREQVQLVLGSPSTTSTISGDTYYYISQTIAESPLSGRTITDQKILAVYFDENGMVKQIANYGLQDGKVFDFISRKTRTGGADLNLLSQMLQGVGNINPLEKMQRQ